jgi:hypothetical protein
MHTEAVSCQKGVTESLYISSTLFKYGMCIKFKNLVILNKIYCAEWYEHIKSSGWKLHERIKSTAQTIYGKHADLCFWIYVNSFMHPCINWKKWIPTEDVSINPIACPIFDTTGWNLIKFHITRSTLNDVVKHYMKVTSLH